MDITGWIAERYDLSQRLGNWAARGVAPALEGVTGEMASWRPVPDQHTIGEIVAHLAYHAELGEQRLRGGAWEYVDIATHDSYHAGQIFVLKRLFGRINPRVTSGP